MVAGAEAGDGGSDGVDDAGCFVAHDEGAVGDDVGVDAAVDPEVDLLDEHLAMLIRLGVICDSLEDLKKRINC